MRFYLYEMSRIGKVIETESRSAVAGGGSGTRRGWGQECPFRWERPGVGRGDGFMAVSAD